MKYLLSNVKVPLGASDDLKNVIAHKIGLPPKSFTYDIYRRSLDVRRHEGYWVYRVLVDAPEPPRSRDATPFLPAAPVTISQRPLSFRPIVVGLGPSGLFASLILARSGNPPIILERGKDVDKRKMDIEALRERATLNNESNVCYGEGGAGTFSDGKLHTGVNSPYGRFVLEEMVKHGAPKDILIDSNPHIGSDLLPAMMKSFREELLSLGADILFSSKFADLETTKDGLLIKYLDDEGTAHRLTTKACLLAYGHSPFDTAKMLQSKGLSFVPKDFSLGVRIEFKQADIDRINYREFYGKTPLPASSFHSVSHLSSGRSVYSFCMCPGGEVVNSSSEEGSVVTNGMSKRDRALENGNAALLVNLRVDDYFKGDALDGYRYREFYERKAYRAEKPYFAPSSRLADFLKGQPSASFGSVTPTYQPGVYLSSFNDCLPSFTLDALREGIGRLSEFQAFYRDIDAVITGVETRSSSPVRIPRNERFESNIPGLFPIGEGASFAGGITSAAIDGVTVAMKIVEELF